MNIMNTMKNKFFKHSYFSKNMNKKGEIIWAKISGATCGMIGFVLLGIGGVQNIVIGQILIGVGGALIAIGS